MIELTILEGLLSRAAPQPDEEFTANLRGVALQAYDRAFQQAHSKRPLFRRRQILGWAVAAAFILLFGLFMTPPGRVLAQRIVRFGLFIFTNEPPSAEQMLTATPETIFTPHSIRVELSSASEAAGFPVFYPAFLPEGYAPAGYHPERTVEVVFNSSGNVVKVGTMFEQIENGKILSFDQIPLDPDGNVPPLNFGTGEVEPQLIRVDGNDGVWLQDFLWGMKVGENGQTLPVPYNLLIWEVTVEDGHTFQFWLGSEEQLPLEVMLQIAESVRQSSSDFIQ